MDNILKQGDMPLGLGMALSKNLQAMNYFSNLSQQQQHEIIEHTHLINSKKEMIEYVNNLPSQAIIG